MFDMLLNLTALSGYCLVNVFFRYVFHIVCNSFVRNILDINGACVYYCLVLSDCK